MKETTVPQVFFEFSEFAMVEDFARESTRIQRNVVARNEEEHGDKQMSLSLQRAETILDDALDRQHVAVWRVIDEYFSKLKPSGPTSEAIEALADVQASIADALDDWQNCLDRMERRPQHGATLQ
jgi:hypothetical protein